MVNKMKEKNELLMHIYDVSYMGEYSTNKLLSTLKSKNNKIKSLLEDELKEIEEGWVNATDRKDVRKDIHSATDGLLSFSTFLFSKYQRLVK